MNKKGLLLLSAALLVSASAFAQSRKGLVINEVMVQNDSSLMDDYGKYTGWIELYNSTHGTMDVASVYITTDRNNAENARYAIPKNDVNTKIQPLQYAVFHTDGEPGKGTFHTSIELIPGQDNFIALFDANGETLIDSIVVPANLGANQSYVRMPNGEWEIHNGTNNPADYITPGSPNTVVEKNNKVENFAINDPYGVGMAVMAMCVVFSALLLLYILFRTIGKINARAAHRNKLESHGVQVSNPAKEITSAGVDSGEEIAAICMALYEHLNAHDEESTILTIDKVRKTYSPWSSKIYTLRELPRK